MATSSMMTTIWTEKRILQHPFHEHALTLRELSKDFEVSCFLCDKTSPGGRAYCCEECRYILHEACALVEIPPVIEEHPYHHHPGHPLNLVLEWKRYCCSADCGFSLDVLMALATRLLPQDVEEDWIHVHRLSFSRVEIVQRVLEHLWGEQMFNQVYERQSFLLLLHEVCARLDLEIQHPLHCQHPLTLLLMAGEHTDETFVCKVCSYNVKPPSAYCCKECRFALHLQCTVTTMHSSSSAIEHHSHKHPLTPLIHVTDMFQFSLQCKFCGLNISGDEAYACIDCSFFIHKSCAESLPEEILQHPFHPQHPRLVLRAEGSGECDSCSEDIASNVAFSCGDCEFNLHRSCALEPLSYIVEKAASVYISHFSHEHPLRLALLRSTIRSIGTCKVCNNSTVGTVGYGCITCQDFLLHRSCANLPQKLQHELHPQHELVLSKPPARQFFCFACQYKHRGGLAFYCAKCQFYMGAGCVSLDATLKHPRHEHRLAYYKEITNKLQCSCCGKGCRYDFYCCMHCNFSLHRDCLDHLPPTIDHKSHWHPLQLCDKFVYGRPDDQYCDYCEMIRNPDHGVYRCEECNFSAHIECMISEYKEQANGSVTIGSEKSNQLNIEIASVKEDMETKRRDLKAMEANLKILDPLLQIHEHSDNFQSMVPFCPDKEGLKNFFHEHPLTLRIISDNCNCNYPSIFCKICMEYIHGPCYCCEACQFFLHGLCALVELPLEIQHPCHPNHPLTLLPLLGNSSYPIPYYHCSSKCEDRKLLHVLTAIATLPPQDDEELNEGAYEDEVKRNIEEAERKDHEEVNDIIFQFITPKERGEEEAVTPVVATTLVDDGIIRHFSHKEHPLISFHVEMQLQDRCGLCVKPISGRFYGCRECIFLLHASCVVSPTVIHHHPFGSGFTLAQCRNCVDEGTCIICTDRILGGFVYCLQDGSGGSIFTIHMACALSTGFPRGHSNAHSVELKVYPLHPCPLVFFHIEPGTYSPVDCKACRFNISGEALACPKCRFILHKSCAEKLPEVIHYFLHPDHPLKLMQEPKNKGYQCASCGNSNTTIDIGMVFRCETCEFYLHLNCALETFFAIEEGVAASVPHFTHQHPLQLHIINSISCIACEKLIDDLAYRCATCPHTQLHKSCAELSLELDHPYHPEHLLVLSKSPTGNFYCSVCNNKSSGNNGYAYYCAKCEFYLDFGCATLNLTLKHPRHEHRLAHLPYKESGMPCNACGKACMTDLYICVLCDFRLHYDCLPLLPKITHEGHRLHTLFLKDKFVDGDPNYQYCDHCETLRNPDHGVYHCEECWFSAHIDCMLSKDKVEEQEKEPEVLEAERTKLEPEETETSVKVVARLKEVIDLTRKNIDTTRGSLEALMEKLRELEMEKGQGLRMEVLRKYGPIRPYLGREYELIGRCGAAGGSGLGKE